MSASAGWRYEVIQISILCHSANGYISIRTTIPVFQRALLIRIIDGVKIVSKAAVKRPY